ncbi:MAG: tRNA pseudouridine(38-40) synthase TruA, partial [Erysipelotrichaceae bacterium]|nr:tRNA pseudouridine(38-40) synthase TruA [Erysipelotrichaceae bacterium]
MRLKCIVSYDGTAYKGWQVQPGLLTIQQVIEEVLSSVQNHKTPIVSSGRTDAGVHAVGQVFHFDSTMDISCEKWQYILNSKLPKDIRIQEITEAEESFHARFDACWKHYDYRINTGVFNPFERNYALQLCKPLDIDKMRETASVFVGTHDFTAFNK